MTRDPIFEFCRRTALALVAVVLAICVALLYVRAGRAGCPFGGTGCEFLAQTRYSIVLGLPLPAFLVGYYLALGGAFFLTAHRDVGVRLLAWFMSLLLAMTAFAGSTYLTLVAQVSYGTECEACLAIFACNFLLGVLIGVAGYQRKAEAVRLAVWAAGSLLVIAVPTAAAVGFASGLERGPVAARPAMAGAFSVHFRSPEVALVLDPSCSVCAEKWSYLRAALSDVEQRGLTSGVDILLLPADEECMRLVDVPVQQSRTGACRVAAHVFCAAQQGAAAAYLGLIYESIRSFKGHGFMARLDAEKFRNFEDSLGLDPAQQQACTGDDELRWRPEDMPEAQRTRLIDNLRGALGVEHRTPALRVGGQVMTPAGDRLGIVHQIESALPRRVTP